MLLANFSKLSKKLNLNPDISSILLTKIPHLELTYEMDLLATKRKGHKCLSGQERVVAL